jgi:hypothetical protein
LLASCGSQAPALKPTGVAYAGPVTLNLRKELAPRSALVGTVKHGDRLEVLDTRRRFVKVRTEQGSVGWTDSNLLLTEGQMDDLRRLAQRAAKLPSQGTATVYDAVNLHTEPARQSPSFYQIPESGSVEVIGHRVALRVQPLAPAAPRRAPPPKKAKAKASKRTGPPPPPPPRPPAPPPNWLELSRPRPSDLPGYEAPVQPAPALDDWNLVRTHDGQAGWVLSRMLTMAIPDEVAQYAEGRRITSYLPLGDVKDEDQTKHNWLWTTADRGMHDYEFDSFRVFVWSIRRTRYETAYIERNVKGYYPVEAQTAPGQDESAFSLVLEDKDGTLYKYIYGFSGYRVHMISKTPYQRTASPDGLAPASVDASAARHPAEAGGWRLKLLDWRKRWFGR